MIDLVQVVSEARESGDYTRLIEAIPYSRFLGMRVQLHKGRVRVQLPFQPMLIGNPGLPSIHGGVVGAMLESSALLQLIHDQGGLPMPKTIDFTVDYLRAAKPQDLFADAEVQRAGRRIANVRMRVYQSAASEPVALARGNFLLD
jgi:uncharacterized protein (TIGR00369 family)